MALGAAMLALTAGIGLLAFAKLYGGIFLGRARSRSRPRPRARGTGVGLLGLAVVALGLGAVAPWEIRWLGRGLESARVRSLHDDDQVPARARPRLRALLRPRPHLARARHRGLRACVGGARPPPPPPARAARPGLGLRHRRRGREPTSTPPTATPTRSGSCSPAPTASRELEPADTRTRARIAADARRPGVRGVPLPAADARQALRCSGWARRLQSGRLSVYLLYILVVLLAALALIPALHDR